MSLAMNIGKIRTKRIFDPFVRESSFNMTRGDEDIEGGLRNF